MIKINLKIETTDYRILKSKQYILEEFFRIYNVKYASFYLKTINKNFSLLRSPHIHKDTWRKYSFKKVHCKYDLMFKKDKHLLNLSTLLKSMSAHSYISMKITKI
jgi:hypothetical protein